MTAPSAPRHILEQKGDRGQLNEQSTRGLSTGRGLLEGTVPRLLKRAVVAQTAFILVAVWSYAAWRISDDHEQSLESGRNQLRTVSASVHAHVEAIVSGAVGSAVAASNEVRARGGFDQLSDSQLADLLRRHLTGGDYVRALLVATPQRYAQITRDQAALLDSSPPEWLEAVMHQHPGDTYVGHSIELSAAVSEQVVPVAVRISGGTTEGMWAGALLGLESLDRLYRRMRFDNGVLGVFVPNGDVLVRVPPAPQSQISAEVVARRAELARQQANIADEMLFEIGGPITGAKTMFYTRRIAGYPLMISAGRATASILEPWRTRTIGVVAVLAGISLLLIALAMMLRHFVTRLERRESQYRTLFNNTAVSVFLMSGDAFLEANATTYRMFRVPPDRAFDGLHPWEISPERQPDGEESVSAAQQRIRAARALGQLTFRWTHKRLDTNEPFPCEVNLSSIQIGDESLMLAIVNDMTELEAARLQLQGLNTELESRIEERTAALQDANARLAISNRELEAFSASASHDLRSPLGSIAGQTGLLREELQPQMNDSIRRRLERIADSVKRCADIIDGLLSLAKVSRQGLINETVDVTATAHSIVDDLRQQHPEHAVTCVITEGVTVNADPRLMKSLLYNLLDNAWKYTAKSTAPTVEFHCVTRDGAAQFSVRDNGVGFDMTYADRIFEPFHRMHSAAEFPGIGVGLATVARIVQRYGGKIWVESAPGNGAVFHFTLPAATADDRVDPEQVHRRQRM